jgi:hypothetical protein
MIKHGYRTPTEQIDWAHLCGRSGPGYRLQRSARWYFEARLANPNPKGVRLPEFALASPVPSYRAVPRRFWQERSGLSLGSPIDEVLWNPEYRDNANSLGQAIANTNGLEKAVDLLVEALGLPRPLKREFAQSNLPP